MTRHEFLSSLGKMDKKKREFAEWIWDVSKDVKPLTKDELPFVWYCESGDILHVTLDMEATNGYYCRRDPLGGPIDTKHSFDTDKLVGFEVWGFAKHPGESMEAISSMPLDYVSRQSILSKSSAVLRSKGSSHEKEQAQGA